MNNITIKAQQFTLQDGDQTLYFRFEGNKLAITQFEDGLQEDDEVVRITVETLQKLVAFVNGQYILMAEEIN